MATAVSMPERNAPFRSVFVAIVFLGSFLLFLVEPLVARLALPVLGGSPSVWNTAMLFYQAALLGGYLYAHLLQRLPFRWQLGVHLALFLLSLSALPVGLRAIGAADTGPGAVFWLLRLLFLSIGPIFLLVAAQAPLMQAWYARSPDRGAASPWFLYAASNAGSLLGLFSYPFLLEPFSGLHFQQQLWSALYILLILLVALGGVLVLRARPRPAAPVPDWQTVPDTVAIGAPAPPVGWWRRLHWVALAAVPSGLMLSTTTHITTDIMAMPLLWVLPLSIYLLSFILVFSRFGARCTRVAVVVAPFALLLFGGGVMLAAAGSMTSYGLASLLLLLLIAVALHGTLAGDRPAASQLTEYYLLMALGGVVGGLFPALIAPLVFDWVYEHPILLLAAALLLPVRPFGRHLRALWNLRRWSVRVLKIVLPLSALALSWWLGIVFRWYSTNALQIAVIALVVVLGIAVIGRRLLFTTVLLALMLGLGGWQQIDISTIPNARQRSFFGIYSINDRASSYTRELLHGTTLHGAQSLDPDDATEPLTYYGRGSGVGLAMMAAPSLYGPHARIAVVGLGTGTLVCYARPGEDWTVFEIDPLIVRIATNPRLFSFVSTCRPDLRIVLGDARLKLAGEPQGRFDLLAVDAFSSDAIPLHLLTEEAFRLYERVLSPEGVLLVHISNRYLDLAPVVAAITHDLGLENRAYIYQPTAEGYLAGETGSIWIAVARNERAMTAFTEATGDSESWLPNPPEKRVKAWTDDFASILPVLNSLRLPL